MTTPFVKFTYEGDMVLVVCQRAHLAFAWPLHQLRDDEGLRKFLDQVEVLCGNSDGSSRIVKASSEDRTVNMSEIL